MKTSHILFLLLPILILSSGCYRDKDRPESPPPITNSGELITTVILHFKNAADSVQFDAVFRDPDGEGGSSPTEWDSISLAAGKTYEVRIELLDESDPTDVEDITEEVFGESADHLFCYSVSGTDISIHRTDSDGVYEIGILSEWTTGVPGTGITIVTLKHQPGIKDGTCAPGDTDIELAFITQVM